MSPHKLPHKSLHMSPVWKDSDTSRSTCMLPSPFTLATCAVTSLRAAATSGEWNWRALENASATCVATCGQCESTIRRTAALWWCSHLAYMCKYFVNSVPLNNFLFLFSTYIFLHCFSCLRALRNRDNIRNVTEICEWNIFKETPIRTWNKWYKFGDLKWISYHRLWRRGDRRNKAITDNRPCPGLQATTCACWS